MKSEIEHKAYMVPNPVTPNEAIQFDEERCTACNICVHVCRTDVLMPSPEKGKPPILLYPDECWYCGVCVEDCPEPGSIAMIHPMHQTVVVNWKRKDTGKTYRLGMKNPPEPNDTPPAR